MTTESVLSVPRLGEGIVEVRIVRFLKQPGDAVAKDEVVYEMEHDKAAVEIESPVAGILDAWLVRAGDTVAIGGAVGRIVPDREKAGTGPRTAAAERASGASVQGAPGREFTPTRRIPPRTRAHARRLGIDEALLPDVPAAGTSLMPADLQRYVARQRESGADAGAEVGTVGPPGARGPSAPVTGFTDVTQSIRQRALNRAMLGARDQVVPRSSPPSSPRTRCSGPCGNTAAPASRPSSRPLPGSRPAARRRPTRHGCARGGSTRARCACTSTWTSGSPWPPTTETSPSRWCAAPTRSRPRTSTSGTRRPWKRHSTGSRRPTAGSR